MKKVALLLNILCYGLNVSAQTRVLSFQETLQMAIQQNVGIRKAQNNIESAKWDIYGSKNMFLPNATFNGGFTFQSGSNLLTVATPSLVASTFTGLNFQANSNYVLADGGARKTQVLVAQKTEEVVTSQLKFTRQQVINDLSLAFLQLSLDKRLIEIATQNWHLSQDRDTILTDLVKAGLRLPNELYQQQAQTRMDEQQVITAKNLLQNHKIFLIRRLNLPAGEYDFQDLPEEALPNFTAPDLVGSAYTKRYDLLALKQQREVTSLRAPIIQANLKPQLVASGGFTTAGRHLFQQNINGNDVLKTIEQRNIIRQLGNQINVYAGLNLVWNIFDRNQTKTALAKNRIEEANREMDIIDRQDQIRAEINQALTDYETAQQQFTTAQAQLSAAQAAFELQEGRFQNGLAPLIDLFVAQNALASAKVNVARAGIQIRYQQKLIQFYVGDGQE
ncbi:TolC family protein [Emticicia sp. BO119]|uniref:TolC family protein n=1 Tax=Emticicia sp. BO119 TaxID=2757768 RepID=UPI0015F023CC|nr:TolC family protein [Emticicia sp. BO119]MBA4853685.1 TolC family protein [Emticicia sp. BO119]